ncbi:F-box protein At3g07870-like [Rhododendron vialii]|uniref:F-box protein At3g07870-like n=1 Tax=Rhododendron vialii TaxID=182163 RepID=UPI00265ED720|nr:F-box protein At3g07870-like [Rhododendron vialii]
MDVDKPCPHSSSGVMASTRGENPFPINQQFRRRMKRKKNKRRRRAKKKAETKSQPCGFPNIPEEIIVDILSRLSLGSLSRFTCVSKQWCSLVADIIPTVTGRKMVLVQSVSRSGTPTFHSIDEESHEKQVWRLREKRISRRPPRFFGSCNGLVLLNITDDLFLWNPVTSYFKKVLSYERLAFKQYRVVSGLCYDSLSGEYKALVALHRETPGYYGDFVMVGSFKSKDWRMVGFSYPVGTVESGPVVNENLHWYASKKNSVRFLPCHQIIYFNPHLNNFKKVPMPEPKHEEGDMIFGLGVLDGCLSMVRHDNPSNYECHSVEVLAMKEYGMKKSWTLLFIISNLTLTDGDTLEPLCYTKDDEALMKVSTDVNGDTMRAYNVNDLHREISVQNNRYCINAIKYEESLIAPTSYDWEDEELRGEATYTEFLYGDLYKYQKTGDGYWESFNIEKRDFEEQNSEDGDQLEIQEG